MRDVGIDQCLLPSANITNTHTLQPYQGVSYGCSNVYIPGGFWYTTKILLGQLESEMVIAFHLIKQYLIKLNIQMKAST
eukprot:gene14104-15591_t